MKKILHPCDAPQWDGKKYPVFVKVEFENGELSLTGVIGPRSTGNAKGGYGQIDMEFDHADPTQNATREHPIHAGLLRFAPNWDRSKWHKLLDIWHTWHLNTRHPECEHQRALGWTYNEHHDATTFKGEACPVCGYEIGSGWNTVKVPAEVIDFLNSLPDTDRTPAWV